jgi:hypothetical protein
MKIIYDFSGIAKALAVLYNITINAVNEINR